MELLIVLILTLLNGFFALSEIALVSFNKSKIEHLASKGNKKAEKYAHPTGESGKFFIISLGWNNSGRIMSGAYEL